MLKPILHNIINQPRQWKFNADGSIFHSTIINRNDIDFNPTVVGQTTIVFDVSRSVFRWKVVQPVSMKLSVFGKLRLRRTIKKWKAKNLKQMIKQLDKENRNRAILNRTASGISNTVDVNVPPGYARPRATRPERANRFTVGNYGVKGAVNQGNDTWNEGN